MENFKEQFDKMKNKYLIRRLIVAGAIFLIVFFMSYGISYSSTLKKRSCWMRVMYSASRPPICSSRDSASL